MDLPEASELSRKRNRMKRERREREDAARKTRHVYNGFPHLSSTTGRCLCTETCCFGPAGCRCRACACAGRGHDAGQQGSAVRA